MNNKLKIIMWLLVFPLVFIGIGFGGDNIFNLYDIKNDIINIYPYGYIKLIIRILLLLYLYYGIRFIYINMKKIF